MLHDSKQKKTSGVAAVMSEAEERAFDADQEAEDEVIGQYGSRFLDETIEQRMKHGYDHGLDAALNFGWKSAIITLFLGYGNAVSAKAYAAFPWMEEGRSSYGIYVDA